MLAQGNHSYALTGIAEERPYGQQFIKNLPAFCITRTVFNECEYPLTGLQAGCFEQTVDGFRGAQIYGR